MHPRIPCSFALLLLLLSLSTQSLADADNNDQSLSSFSIVNRVIPRDPLPSDNNNEEGLMSSSDNDKTFEAEITATRFHYLMTLNITMPHRFAIAHANLDTGSNLVWVNGKKCTGKACVHCRDGGECIENPKDLLGCDTDCILKKKQIEPSRKLAKCLDPHKCDYNSFYIDGSGSTGFLGRSQFWFPISGGGTGTSVDGKFRGFDVVFGVSSESRGNLGPKSEGVVGLGKATGLSLLAQAGGSQLKFTYCLPRYDDKSSKPKKSKLIYGPQVTTSGTVIRLLKNEGRVPSYCENLIYCVRLSSISLEGHSFGKDKITVRKLTDNDVMTVDSGTTFTLLQGKLFTEFLKKVKHVIGDEEKPKPKSCDKYNICFKEEDAKKLEKVSLEFDGGATVELKRENFFDHCREGEINYLCLTVVDGVNKKHERLHQLHSFGRQNNGNDPLPLVLGNRAQMDFKVAFDVPNNEVSFDATNECGEHNAIL